MSGVLIALASDPAPVEGGITKLIMTVMLSMGLLMLLAFAARVKSEWSR
ncbi:MAG: hypothetical protein Kow0022_02100 [Phycisphaerales bacterium]